MTPHEADNLLARFLGNDLQSATVRLLGATLILAAVAALLITFI